MANVNEEQRSIIEDLLDSYDLTYEIAPRINTERPCAGKMKLCTSSKSSQIKCREEYRENKIAHVEDVPADYDAWKKLCSLSVCVHNMYDRFTDIIQSDDRDKRNFRTCVINLIMNHGIVAGGFILATIGRRFQRFQRAHHSISNDIDVYMTPQQFENFASAFDTLVSNYPQNTRFHDKSIHFIYSGLANNPQNIMYHMKLSILLREGRPEYLVIDIVVSRDPLHTIEHFDLSFCKVRARCVPDDAPITLTQVNDDIPLFDIARFKVRFGDYDALFRRSGTLSKPFAREYYDGNKTTRNRVIKYSKRGYTILIPTLPEYHPEGSVTMRGDNYTRLLQNRIDLPSGKKCIRSLIHIIANETPLAWIAKNYVETQEFAVILLSYIEHENMIARHGANLRRYVELLEEGLRQNTLTWS